MVLKKAIPVIAIFDVSKTNKKLFSSSGASFVYLNSSGRTLMPLYNYLKDSPQGLSEQLYQGYAGAVVFAQRDLADFAREEEAYHQFMLDLTEAQCQSTKLIMNTQSIHRIFVDGGFSKNSLYMN